MFTLMKFHSGHLRKIIFLLLVLSFFFSILLLSLTKDSIQRHKPFHYTLKGNSFYPSFLDNNVEDDDSNDSPEEVDAQTTEVVEENLLYEPRIFHDETDPHIKKISDFKRCTIFNNCLFNTSVTNGSEIISFIDSQSQQIENAIRKRHPDIERETDAVYRFSCYEAAASFKNPEKRMLYRLNATAAFPAIPFDPKPVFEKKKAKIAYLLMAHGWDDNVQVERVMNVIKAIRHNDSFVLVHIDQPSEGLFKKIRDITKDMDNVYVTEKRTRIGWGHSSMVFAQLSGFFELLDLAEWDFVLNLSVHDYPVRSPKYIHRALMKNRVYLEQWHDEDTSNNRCKVVYFLEGRSRKWGFLHGRNEFPFKEMTVSKHHQWMVLPRSYVEYLRTEDYEAHELLMYIEPSCIPDEWYFSTSISRKDHPFKSRLINNNKRYITPFNGYHPRPLTYGSVQELVSKLATKDYFLARKVDNIKERKLISWFDSMKVASEKHIPPFPSY